MDVDKSVKITQEPSDIHPKQRQVDRLPKKSLRILFVIVALISILIAYYFNYIGKDWINRIGILLNFCAGFLVSPELLVRSELLSIVEQKLSSITQSTQESLSLLQLKINKLFDRYSQGKGIDVSAIFICLLLGSCIFFAFKNIGTSFIYPFVIFTYIMFSFAMFIDICLKIFKRDVKDIVIRRYIIALLITPVFFPIFVFGYPIMFIVLQVLRLTSMTLQNLLDKVIGDGRLRSTLVGWGVVSFIFGNIFQFLATF